MFFVEVVSSRARALSRSDLCSLFNSLELKTQFLTALFTSGWSLRATLRYAALISDFEAERGTPRTTWAGRGDEEDEATTTKAAMAESFFDLLFFLCCLLLCWKEGAALGAAMLCSRGEGTAAAATAAAASLARSGTQRIVAREERELKSLESRVSLKKNEEKVKNFLFRSSSTSLKTLLDLVCEVKREFSCPPFLSPPRSASFRAAASLRAPPSGFDHRNDFPRHGVRSMRRRALDGRRRLRRRPASLLVLRRRRRCRFDFQRRCFRRREVDQLALRHGLW